MIIIVEENIKLELTTEKFATQLFDVINTNREHLSQFLPWVENIQSVENFRLYLKNCELLYEKKKK